MLMARGKIKSTVADQTNSNHTDLQTNVSVIKRYKEHL